MNYFEGIFIKPFTVDVAKLFKDNILNSKDTKEFLKKYLAEDAFTSLKLSRTQQKIKKLTEN